MGDSGSDAKRQPRAQVGHGTLGGKLLCRDVGRDDRGRDELVQNLLGHASITATLDRYSLWIPEHTKAHRRQHG